MAAVRTKYSQGSGNVGKPVVIRFQTKGMLEDYAKIGNFLRKYEADIAYTQDELVHVSRAQVDRLDHLKPSPQAEVLLNADYKDIDVEQAPNLHRYLKNYQIYFYIEVYGAEVDPFTLTNFQYLYLLFTQFPALDISCIIVDQRKEQSLYHRLSHYFALLNTDSSYCPNGIQGGRIYDHVLFYNGQRFRRLQKKRIGALQTFLPLIPICSKSSQELFRPMAQILSSQDIKDIETVDWKTPKQDMFDLLDGCKALLSRLYDHLPSLVEHDFSGQVLAKMNQLTFFIFCYSAVDMTLLEIANSGTKVTSPETEKYLRGYAERLAAYSIGLRQVVENIVHYAQGGIGALSLRRYEPEKFKVFLEGRGIHQFAAQNCTYLVFEIADYSPLEKIGNLSETFKRGLPEDMQKPFQAITPADFFRSGCNGVGRERERDLEIAWRSYRSFGDNLTKHFGLYIFQQMISDSKGLFFMESHSTHTEGSGERYVSLNDVGGPDSQFVLPGTAYTVCLPLSTLERAQDSSIDKRNFSDNFLNYLTYQAEELSIPFDGRYGSPEEKRRLVNDAASQLQTDLEELLKDNGDKKIFQLNMRKEQEMVYGELWCKALLVALFSLQARPRFFAFYNCSPQFIDQFKEDMSAFFHGTEGCNPLGNSSVQISLFQENEIDSLVLFPESQQKTWSANEQLSKSRGLPNQFARPDQLIAQGEAVEIAPLEVICRPEKEKNDLTLFELYTKKKLTDDIQGRELGCKIEHTHMRLGSAVHICTFYEAELLFSNSLFYSRFAFLLMKDLWPKLQKLPRTAEQIVLYGYSSYSELLLVELQTQLYHWAKVEKRTLQVEYLILEREAEQRGFDHTNRIRSSSGISVETLRQSPETKYIMVVPVNSTLKTHNKMYFLLKRAGIHLCSDETDPNNNLIGNFALITVGPPERVSKYWDRNPENRTIKSKVKELPVSIYSIYLEEKYYEAVSCEYCFPQNPLAERPLIEVNAASTIPNQSFSLNEGSKRDPQILSWSDIKAEQDKLECLRQILAYGHIERGENHFLYYFYLEKLLLFEKGDIAKRLQDFREEHVGSWDDYNIIFSPLHFSNAGFVELINHEVFSGSALVIRMDVDKEFRTNAKAKFSYLKTMISNLGRTGRETTVRVHYVDDNILSGRTFHRSKSLVMSLLQMSEEKLPSTVSIRIFDTLFLLLNRNSESSMQSYYTNFFDNTRTKCFCFLNLRISSLRTHGDSCVLCNLYREADRMREMSSTKLLYNKWGEKKERFRLRTLEEHGEAARESLSGPHGFYRLVAAHTAGIALSGAALYDKRCAFLCMAELILADLKGRTEDKQEYFFSYLKVISRPFLIFHKTIKEAVLDLLLVLMEHCLGSNMGKIRESLEELTDKQYLCKEPIYSTLESLVCQVDQVIGGYEADYLKILMSQLTELKSNYTLHMEKMETILHKVDELVCGGSDSIQRKWEFYAFYLMQIKRLTSISSDTSKSLWLTEKIYQTYAQNQERPIPKVVELAILENTRVLFDAAPKLVDGLTLGRDDGSDAEKRVGELLESLYYIWMEKQQDALSPLLQMHSHMDVQKRKHFADRYDIENDYWNGNEQKAGTMEEQISQLQAENQRQIRKGGGTPGLPMGEYSNLLDGVLQEDTYLYENLKSLMNDMGYMKTDQLNREGTQLLLALSALWLHLRLCFPETEPNEPLKMPVFEIYSRLTTLLRYLLDADKLCIVTEMPAKYNVWKATIAKSFDRLAEKKDYSTRLFDGVDGEDYTEYLTLADGRLNGGGDKGASSVNYQVESEIIEALRTYKGLPEEEKKTGYLLQKIDQKAQFVLSLGGPEGRGIYLYARFYQVDRIALLHRISCGLLFYPKLVGTVFDEKENRLLRELVQERYDLSIQQRAKAHSHTRDQELVNYYESAFVDMPNKTVLLKDYPKHRESDVLALISDLIISDIYRNSLSEDFYLPGKANFSTLKQMLKGQWSPDKSYLALWMKDPQGVSSSENQHAYIELRLQFLPDSNTIKDMFGSANGLYSIDDADRIRYLSSPIASMRVPLFLLALARNAVKYGICENHIVDVYFVKTEEHNLRIANRVKRAQASNPDTLQEKYLNKPPTNKKDGISLWSVSRYVQAIAAAYLDSRLNKLKDISLSSEAFSEKAGQFVKLYQRMTSPEFALQVEIVPVPGQGQGDEVLFCVDLPLLEEKYNLLEKGEEA